VGRQTITYPCTACSTAFKLNPVQSARVRKDNTAAVFCSRKCAGVDNAAPLVCAFCKNEFDATGEQRRSFRHGHRVYCSTNHYHADRVTYTCDVCKLVFVTTPYQRRMFYKTGVARCVKCRASSK